MAFGAPFSRTFRPPFGPNTAAAAASWWLSGGISAANCIAAYQPKGAASLAASYTNLANPGTYTAAPGVAPTWNAITGWAGNASSMYLTTGIVPASGWSMIVRYSGYDAAATVQLCGRRNSATDTRFFLSLRTAAISYGSGGALVVSPNQIEGSAAVTGQTAYRSGVADGAISAWSGTVGTPSIFILAYNVDGSAAEYTSATIQAIAIYNITLSAAQILAVHTAMMAL